MSEYDTFVNDIPTFLRRAEESCPDDPIFGIGNSVSEDEKFRKASSDEQIVASNLYRNTVATRDAKVVNKDFSMISRREIIRRMEALFCIGKTSATREQFGLSRPEIARRQDTIPESVTDNAPQLFTIELPGLVACALKARAERNGCDESAVVLEALLDTETADFRHMNTPA